MISLLSQDEEVGRERRGKFSYLGERDAEILEFHEGKDCFGYLNDILAITDSDTQITPGRKQISLIFGKLNKQTFYFSFVLERHFQIQREHEKGITAKDFKQHTKKHTIFQKGDFDISNSSKSISSFSPPNSPPLNFSFTS